ncbi:hypothetical protein HYG87_00620 [Methanobacterium alkalithermotolerans]|uniref:DISARM protein DrmE C-terminal domain-containing protein n=1 Tax=Methanobacterium alkalithermotolerans TaxID=2731220 RepID=A0A8T8K350_9EURY|nr:hypothetical protein [Methanobacterium alkalithermotolerans]QUH22372.1 hypothetical protein HYG87_00620 [Methanobacterium alkalithermotolerans]
MEKWASKIHHINTYNPDCKDAMDYYYNTKLTENISPLTNFFLNTFLNSMDKKNIIVTFPDNILRPLPLIAYSYSFLKNKSTMVFTSSTRGLENKSPREIHNMGYYMLNWDGEYLFYDIPIGFIFKDKVEAKIKMPLANRRFKKKYIEHLKNNFTNTNGPKILLYADNGTRIVDTVNNILLDNKNKFKHEMNFDLGCIIFENVDRYVNSKYTSKQFINWIKDYHDKDINFIFHFSNPNSPFINYIKDKTDSFVIPFNNGILTNNEGISIPSLEYYDKKDPVEIKIIENYNLDRPYFYHNDSDITVFEPLLEAGNIDKHFMEAKNLLKRVLEDQLFNKKLYYRSLGLLYSLQDLIINPSKYKLRYGDKDIGWRFFSITEFLEMFQSRLPKENTFNQLVLGEYITQLENIYSELSKCRRFGEESSFNRIGKDYKILEIAQNKNDYFSDHVLMIGAYSNSEASVLREELERWDIDGIEVRHIGWLNKSHFDRSNYSLLLPGPIPVKYFSELLRPYKKILVLAYEGYNFNRIKDQMKLVSDFSVKEEIVSMNYFKEIYEFMGIPQNDALFEDYHKRINEKEIETDTLPSGNVSNTFDDLKELISIDSSEYKEDLDNLGRMIKHIKSANQRTEESKEYSESLEFYLRNLETGKKYKKTLPLAKTYFFLKNIGSKIEEGSPKELKPGNFVIVIDNDEKKTLLQLIIEIYDLESSIDKEIIEFWKERLMLFIKDTGIKYKQFYDAYNNFGGEKHYQTVLNWCKGRVIGPEESKDLYYIGKILDEEILINNHKLISEEIGKVRNIHRTTGRKLKKVIKSVIFEGSGLDAQNLNYEEYLFYEKVKNGIYEVLEIK